MERITRFRGGLVLAAFIAVLVLFSLRLFDLQVANNDTSTSNIKTFTIETIVKAARGEILDCKGNVLVTNRASYDLMFNHYVIRSAEDTNGHLLRLVQLCRQLEVEYIDHFPVTQTAPFSYTLSDYDANWQGYFQAYLPKVGGLDSDITAPLLINKLREFYDIPESWSAEDARAVLGLRYELALRSEITNLPNYVFLEDADSEVLASLLELNVPGLKAEATTVREYNTQYAAHILGFVGPITKDQWDNTYKEKPGYAMDTLVGQNGLELAFEEYLHATDGIRVDVVTVDGTVIDSYYKVVNGVEKRPIAGQNVEISIDLTLQSTAEQALESLITELRASGENLAEGEKKPDGSDCEGGAVVVMNVKTGQILVCASYPTYNLSTYHEDYNKLLETAYGPLLNRALQTIYPPGSTFKPAMIIAGINSGVIVPGTTITDRGEYTKYAASGFSPACMIWNTAHATHGTINALEALRDSCNYYFYALTDELGLSIGAIDATSKGLGLGESTGVELFEYTGRRSNPETKMSLFSDPDLGRWYPADLIMTAIGQSENRFTPMQLCSYTMALANRGTRYSATFMNRVLSSDYSQVNYSMTPEILSTYEISDWAYYAYTQGMRLVVTSPYGSTYGTFGNYPVAIAAKTGTAQHEAGGSDHGAFICYAPFDDPEIAIVVYGEKAGRGSTMSQIAKAITDAYFHDIINGDSVTGENTVS